MHADLEILYERSRGGQVESVHFGAFAVVSTNGELLAGRGDPQLTTFLRSSAKPIQALPFVEAGGPEHFGLTQAELALICASHTGSAVHTSTAAAIQARAGILETHLQCGAHVPHDRSAAAQLKQSGLPPTPNHNNCSGKHSGMVAFACMKRWPLEDYLSPDHPVQRAILKTLAELADFPETQIGIGTDGCSAPNFTLPLYNTALAFARLADPSGLPAKRAAACRQITSAMMAHPEMVAGPGEFDTQLMAAAGGRIFAKGGAEGYQVAGVLPNPDRGNPTGLGIAIKVSDGDPGGRVRAAVLLEILKQNGVLSTAQLEALAEFGPERPILNVRKTEVGRAGPSGPAEDFVFAMEARPHGSR